MITQVKEENFVLQIVGKNEYFAFMINNKFLSKFNDYVLPPVRVQQSGGQLKIRLFASRVFTLKLSKKIFA